MISTASNCGAYATQQLATCPGMIMIFSMLAFKLGYPMFEKAATGEYWCGFVTKRWEGLLSRRFREKRRGRQGSEVAMGVTEIWPEGEMGYA